MYAETSRVWSLEPLLPVTIPKFEFHSRSRSTDPEEAIIDLFEFCCRREGSPGNQRDSLESLVFHQLDILLVSDPSDWRLTPLEVAIGTLYRFPPLISNSKYRPISLD